MTMLKIRFHRILICATMFMAFTISAKAETAIKLNGLYALGGVVNPAVEVGVAKNFTIQLEAVASFYQGITLDIGKIKVNDMPMLLGLGFLEMHWFPKERFKGFYVGPTIGYGAFKLQKWEYWNSTEVQYGTSVFLGATVGYQWQVKNWTFDLFVGGGWIHSIYEGYDYATGERYDKGKYKGKYNKSAEWLPFKGGVMIGYRF